MNELIKELVEQSKCYATESTKNFTGNEPIGFMDFYTEKFAELIVKECAKSLEEMPRYYKQEGDRQIERDTIFDCVRTIKEHFGVEE